MAMNFSRNKPFSASDTSITQNSSTLIIIFFLAAHTTSFTYRYIYVGFEDMAGDNNKTSYKWIVDKSSITDGLSWYPGEPSALNEVCGGVATFDALKLFDMDCIYPTGAVCEADLVNFP